MPNIGAMLKQEIARLSRREVRAHGQATKKASVAKPAPKVRAMTKSRTKPRMRESSVMPLTVARARRRFMSLKRCL